MSIAAKQQYIRSVGERLEDLVTVSQMNAILAVMSEEADGFEIEQVECPDGELSLDMLTAFLEAKLIEGRAESTIARYKYLLQDVLHRINVPIRKITVYHLRSYLMSERERGISESTLSGIRSAMCSFFRWLHTESLIERNPTANLGPIKSPKVVREPYSDVEIERLKSACTNSRDVAILTFLLATGCRISEAVNLNRKDIDFISMSCKVLGKGSKERVVYLDSVATMYLKRYLGDRNDTDPALFYSRNRGRITVNGVQRMLKVLEKTTGISNVHPHRFRRTLATNLIHRGMPIQEVARVLGHEKIDTTMRYVYIDDTTVHTSYRKYS